MITDQVISEITKNSLEIQFYDYFKKAKKETRHIILDRFFPEERRISSVMSGFQTSLGSYWEKLSAELAALNDFEVLKTASIQSPENPPSNLESITNEVKKQREQTSCNLDDLRTRLNDTFDDQLPTENFTSLVKGKGVDLVLRKDGRVYIFDIKTVQVNAGNGNTFNENVILWTSHYKYQYRIDARNIFAKLIFPYNSSNENDDDSWWGEFGGRIKPLTKDDVYVGNQYWQFLTDNPNALSAIIAGIDSLTAENGFAAFYQQAFECESREQLTEFAIKVKVYKVERTRGIRLSQQSPDQIINARRILDWEHGNGCLFRSRLNRLAEDADPFDCPTCQSVL